MLNATGKRTRGGTIKRKKKPPSLSALRDKLDGLLSRLVRLSAADSNGYAQCVACGKYAHWTEMDAGHFVGRRSLATRFDLRNVNVECRACNRFSPDHLIGYTIWMQEQHGDMVIAELWAKKHQPVKYTRADYEQLIDDMAGKLAALATSGPSEWALANCS